MGMNYVYFLMWFVGYHGLMIIENTLFFCKTFKNYKLQIFQGPKGVGQGSGNHQATTIKFPPADNGL